MPGHAGAWPQAGPGGWPPAGVPPAQSWPLGVVPWGQSSPPPVPLDVRPPGRFHPRAPVRSVLAVGKRANPRLYGFGLLVGLPSVLALLALTISRDAGNTLPFSLVTRFSIVESVCIVATIGLVAAALAQGAQRRADGWSDYRGPSPFLVFLATLAAINALGQPLALLIEGVGIESADSPTPLGTLLLMPAYLVAYFGIVYFTVVQPGAISWRDAMFPRRLAPDPDGWTAADVPARGSAPDAASGRLPKGATDGLAADLLMGLAILIPGLIMSGLLETAVAALLQLDPTQIPRQVPTGPISTADRLMTLAAVAVLVPIGEELFFRGFATNAWGRSMGRGSTIIRAGVFFAFVHIGNVQPTSDIGLLAKLAIFNVVARLPIGLALCWIYMRRRSIFASAALHGSYNGLIAIINFGV